jgi:hypothetical protein
MKTRINNFSVTVIIVLISMLIGSSVFAQSPEAFKYQAIARDAGGNVLANQSVSLKISILKTSDTGTPVYVETHYAITNGFGLVNLNIGGGTVVWGNFSNIDWGSDNYFIKVEMDPAGGTSYQAMGTSQLLSVPYALYAKYTGNITETDPIFTNSIAHGISGLDTANWNHKLDSYTEIDPIFTNSIAHGITGADTASWNATWKIWGNTGTIEGTNFIGTTDNKYFSIRTNNTEKVRITTKGQIETRNTGQSVFIGEGAGANDVLSNNKNVFIGYKTGYANTTGSNNTANGYQALYSNTSGYNNTATGYQALYSNTNGYYNTANGFAALYYNTTGYYNTANGSQALYYNTTGTNNVALGPYAGLGASNINFNNCTFIGASSYPTVARTNVTMLGYGITNAQCTGDNQVLLGNTSITQIRAQVSSITTYSDARMKFNIKDDVKGLDFIMKLKPVTYNEDPTVLHKIWGTPDSLLKNLDHSQIKQQRFIGFLAQDVEQAAKESGFAFPGIDVPSNDKEVYSLRYVDFIMPMVKAIQEQQGMIDNQQIIIENQQKMINELKSENENMQNANENLQKVNDEMQIKLNAQQTEIDKLKTDLQDLHQLIINNQK